MRVDRLVLELIHQIQLIQQQRHRILPAAIQNGWHLAGAAQAAARTFAQCAARIGS